MNRRVWTGVLAGILAATVLLGVAGAAYRAGQTHEVVTRTVGDGEVVRVVGGDDGGYGHGGGFFFFPFFTILVVFLLFRAARGGRRGGWGYGGWGCGPGAQFEEHHRRMHERAGAGPADEGEA